MKSPVAIGSLSILLGLLMLNAQESLAQAPAAAVEKPLVKVFKTAQPVKVDGVLDEACWKKAIPVKADFIWGAGSKVSAEPRMTAWYTWDDHFLYVAYETFDSNLAAKASGQKQGPADNQRSGCEIAAADIPVDVVEFFVGFNDPNMFWELHHSAANQFNDILVFAQLPNWQKELPAMAGCNIYWAWNEFIQDDGEHKLAIAAQVKPRADGKPSTINDRTDTDTGYIAEMRFPWGGIGAPIAAQSKDGWKKMADREIALLAVVQNGDLQDRYHTSSATIPGGAFFHNNFAHWPRYKLVDAPAE